MREEVNPKTIVEWSDQGLNPTLTLPHMDGMKE